MVGCPLANVGEGVLSGKETEKSQGEDASHGLIGAFL